MAEPRKPRASAAPPAVPPPVASARGAGGADPGAQLEELNDQLARFLQHADQLVDEWARFGADVRRTVDGEVGRIDQAVAEAAERAVRDAGAQVDRLAAERIERVLEQSLGKLRGELERGPRTAAGGTSAAASASATRTAETTRLVLIAVAVADFLLVVLLVMVWRSTPAPVAAGAGRDPGSAVAPPPEVAPEVVDACAALVAGHGDAAAVDLVLGAGLAACGPDAAEVRGRLRERLAPPPPPVDAGTPTDGPMPDARRPRGR